MFPQEVGKGCPSPIGGVQSPLPSRWADQLCPMVPTARGGRGLGGTQLGWGFRKALGGAKGWRQLEFPLQLCLVLNLYYSSFA